MAHPLNGNDPSSGAGSLTAETGALVRYTDAQPGTRRHFTHMALALAGVPCLAVPQPQLASFQGAGEAAFHAFEILHFSQLRDLPALPAAGLNMMSTFARTRQLPQSLVDHSASIRNESLAAVFARRSSEALSMAEGVSGSDLIAHVRQVEAALSSVTLLAPAWVRGEGRNDADSALRPDGAGSPRP